MLGIREYPVNRKLVVCLWDNEELRKKLWEKYGKENEDE